MFWRAKSLFTWEPDLNAFSQNMRHTRADEVHLDRFPRGVDNVHIDVVLSPVFRARATQLVRDTLEHHVAKNRWGEAPAEPDTADLQSFRDSYTGLVEFTVDEARRSGRVELLQLQQLAVVKYLLQLVPEEIDRLRRRLQSARDVESSMSSGKALVVQDRIVALAKEHKRLQYRITGRLLRQVYKLETTSLRRMRKSVIGKSWPLSQRMLFNPLLELPSIDDDELLINHYPLLASVPEAPFSFARINRIVTELFAAYLPEWARPEPAGSSVEPFANSGEPSAFTVKQRLDQGELPGFLETEMLLSRSLREEEFQKSRFTWLDDPENISRLFTGRSSSRELTPGDAFVSETPVSSSRRWRNFCNALVRRTSRRFTTSGLMPLVVASYQAPRVHRMLEHRVPMRLIHEFISGSISQRKLLRRLRGSLSEQEVAKAVKTLVDAARTVRRMPSAKSQEYLIRFLRGFAALRRDLKFAYLTHRAMDRIRILTKEEEIALSRANDSLQEFVIRGESEPGSTRIRCHVAIKADVRGSAAMTAELRRRGLNPASFFSMNFFTPIKGLLERYGATKTFIEGDAIILSIYEYEDVPYQWLSVSHACGLARKILELVDRQNAKNRKNGLPELEIGLGIAFVDEAPTFLYDEDRQITISPAINRADILSSCSAAMRQSAVCANRGSRGVEVVVPSFRIPQMKAAENDMLRYNVNGIELDIDAFFKLASEIALYRTQVTLDGAAEPQTFVAGRYPDINGTMHWLVIREALVQGWDGEALTGASEPPRRFFEVVTDADLVRLVRSQFRPDRIKEPSERATMRVVDRSESDDKTYYH